jgi:hypothetical protein
MVERGARFVPAERAREIDEHACGRGSNGEGFSRARRQPPSNGEEAEMKRLRYLFLAALAGFAVLPVAQVYTSGAPWIQKLEVRNNDLAAVQGKGVAGTAINIYYRQRNFKEGYWDVSEPGVDPFSWCSWLNNGNAIYLGSAVVDAYGNWRLQGLDTQIMPPLTGGNQCGSGLLTEFQLQSAYGVAVPDIKWLNVRKPGNQVATIAGAIEFANQVAAGVADGPNDVVDADHPWTIDRDDDGTDLCLTNLGCGARVSWKASAGTFASPSIQMRDDSPLLGPRDQEFSYVTGMIQGHMPGGSVLAVAHVDRPNPAPQVRVDLNIKGLEKLNICDSLGFFDFLTNLL